MVFWIYLWKFLLIGAMIMFGGMAVWVTIGSIPDIKELFASLRESHEANERDEQ